MNKTSEKVLHAEVVGSLHRPSQLVQARAKLREQRLTWDDYQKIEDIAVDAAITLQEEAGLEVLTDGEMRRDTFFDFFLKGMSGFSPIPSQSIKFHNEKEVVHEITFPYSVTERVQALGECPGVAEFRYATHRTDRVVKVTLPSPMLALNFYGPASRDAYPDPFEFAAEAAEITANWMRQLASAGCSYIQIDAPEMSTVYADSPQWEALAAMDMPLDDYKSVGTELLSKLGAVNIPGVRKALHVCKGNGTQSWLAEGGYAELVKHTFRRLDGFDVFHLEYDDDRSGDFEPLTHLPDDKVAVLGLISTKWPRLEDPDELTARIDDAARYHPKEQLAIAPQCGFASAAETAEERRVLPDTQRAKLRLLTSVARQVWG